LLKSSAGAALAGAIYTNGKAATVGLFFNDCKFENNAGQLSGAIATLLGTDAFGRVPTHYNNVFINNTGLAVGDSAGAYYLTGIGNKRFVFFGTTATDNQGDTAGFMYINSPGGTHAITIRDNPKAIGTSPNTFRGNLARAGYEGSIGGAGVIFAQGSTLTLNISYTSFLDNTGNKYGGVIGIQGGTTNAVNIGTGVTFSGNVFGPVGSATSPFTGRTVVCASSAPPPATSGPSSFIGVAPAPLVSCFDVDACKGICDNDFNGDSDCYTFCDELGARSALDANSTPARVEGPWVETSTYSSILAEPSNVFICNDACWSEPQA
jgi:hypothetical protein